MRKLVYDEVVRKCREAHGDRYEYPSDMLERRLWDGKVPIICPIHGEFWQILHNHYKGCGCPKCGGNARVTTEEFVRTLRKRFPDSKLGFDKVKYVNNHTPITLECPEHGEFTILPSAIGNNLECPECQKKRLSEKYSLTTEEFIRRAREVHGDKYDYSRTEYVNAKVKVCIICPEHGEFWQLPFGHLSGSGCPKCKREHLWDKRARITTEEFIRRAREVHGDRYDYSDVDVVNTSKPVYIKCMEHGGFWQTPEVHLRGNGCPKCARERLREKFQLTKEEFIERARKIHGDKYDYSKVEYVNNNTKVEIVCPKHGSFWQTPSCHFSCSGCPTCKGEMSVSKQENELTSYIREIYDGVICLNDRQVINPLELDIYLPFENLAIEYDGLYWHSSGKVGKNYHLRKTERCREKGIRLIHIFEDEWVYKTDIVKSRLLNILGKTENRIYARKCEIMEVNHSESKRFLDENHIQGNVNGKYRYGLYYNGELVSLMTFGSKRKSLGSRNDEGVYELLRFCNKLNTTVIGGASKLFDHFVKKISPRKVISYCDRRWSDGNLYERVGFEFDHCSQPNYFYVVDGKRENRFKYRKSELVRQGYDGNMTEEEIMNGRGIKKVYDCGSILYVKVF